MEKQYCSKCGTPIQEVFMYQEKKYGFECIDVLPMEEVVLISDKIDMEATINGLIYAGESISNIQEFISNLPKIGTVIIDKKSQMKDDDKPRIIILGYATMFKKTTGIKPRNRKELAIRIKRVYPTYPKMNKEKWLYMDTFLPILQETDKLQ